MDTSTFLVRIIEAAAWPIAAVIIVVLLRSEIRGLLPLIRKLKAGPLEAEFERVRKELSQTSKVASAAKQKAEVIASILDEQDDGPGELVRPSVDDLSPTEQQVLRAMTASSMVMRSIGGVANETGLSKEVVATVLNSLLKKWLVGKTTNMEGQPRWYASIIGRQVNLTVGST